MIDDKLYKAQQKRIAVLVGRLVVELGLRSWDISLRVTRGLIDDEQGVVAMIRTIWPYREAELVVSAALTSAFDDDKLERTLLHEFCHLFIAITHPADRPPTPAEIDLEERACTDLAIAIQSLIEARVGDLVDRTNLAARRAAKQIKHLEELLVEANSSEGAVA